MACAAASPVGTLPWKLCAVGPTGVDTEAGICGACAPNPPTAKNARLSSPAHFEGEFVIFIESFDGFKVRQLTAQRFSREKTAIH
jgi:hypothetical protein